MSTTPRIPPEIVQWIRSGGYHGIEDDGRSSDEPPASFNPELQSLAGIPLMVKGGVQFDFGVAEMIRILNAQTQGCVF